MFAGDALRWSGLFLTNDGYFVIQSGGPNDMREWAGVGFLVVPAFRRSVLGFN